MDKTLGVILVLSLAVGVIGADEQKDILIADFEGKTYGSWKVEGEAFGPGPARGTLPGQMQVSGYALLPTDLRYRRPASETFKNDTDLLICGELTPGSLFDLCNNVFRFCHCFRLLSGVRTPLMEPKSSTSSVSC